VVFVLSLFAYAAITLSILRFFQSLDKLDRRMRLMSTVLYEERPNRVA
jgi:hypothetical protein